ncbi:Major facilitator superfamily domain- general substrate transporter [Apiospora phragmitis]|uniref:Major facilitator superfamily domain- general substrate transporter n=1 Tax=Apiospora phragmitis TaxID=2905665 RepID=A0ABR1URS4_9PEZI
MAIIFGTVYMFMGAMPIVFSQGRGWSEGISSLSFMGIAVGIVVGLVYAIYDNNGRYIKLSPCKDGDRRVTPAPGNHGSRHLARWHVCLCLDQLPQHSLGRLHCAFFAVWVRLCSCHLPVINYLIDSYTIYAASVLAAAAILRSIMGAVFPLFTSQMYSKLGIHWATSIPAFLTLICMPFPFIMYRYGEAVRMKCKYAAEAAEMMRQIQRQQAAAPVAPSKETLKEETSSD